MVVPRYGQAVATGSCCTSETNKARLAKLKKVETLLVVETTLFFWFYGRSKVVETDQRFYVGFVEKSGRVRLKKQFWFVPNEHVK